MIAPSGNVEYVKDFDALEISAKDGGGVRFGANWQSPNLARLGDYRLWVDRKADGSDHLPVWLELG